MSVVTGIEAGDSPFGLSRKETADTVSAYYDLVNDLEQYINDLYRVAEAFDSETARSRAIIVENILERNRV